MYRSTAVSQVTAAEGALAMTGVIVPLRTKVKIYLKTFPKLTI
jgi:hypothetical protein